MRINVWLVLLLATLMTGCSRETMQRTVYGTLQETERNKCLANTPEQCPRVENYDDYQRRRQELENTQQ